MTETAVLNRRDGDHQEGDINIARPSQWGNPFRMGVHGDRAEVIEKYREWILTQPKLLAQLPDLKGKRLVCWCAPLPCHGDVLVELIEQEVV